VQTDRGTYEAHSLVITASPWASQLLPDVAQTAVPERQVLGWFQPSEPGLSAPERFPVFNLRVSEGRYYGFPGFKIGRYHHLEQHTAPDKVDRRIYPQNEELLRAAVSCYFPEANGPAMALKTCLFTNGPDEHFMIGTHSEYSQVSLATGFSGHGFKFCSVVGEITDIVFGEDQHDYAQRRGAGNMSVLRQFAPNLIRQDGSKGSLKGKRKKAAWDDDFRARILSGLSPS